MIPETNNRQDWPRLVANAVNDLIRKIASGIAAYIPGTTVSSEIVAAGVIPFDIGFANNSARSGVAATGDTVFTVRKRTDLTATPTSMGTITFSAGEVTGVFVLTVFKALSGDLVEIVAPASPDATLADIIIEMRA
jgi:hypothetical protein